MKMSIVQSDSRQTYWYNEREDGDKFRTRKDQITDINSWELGHCEIFFYQVKKARNWRINNRIVAEPEEKNTPITDSVKTR